MNSITRFIRYPVGLFVLLMSLVGCSEPLTTTNHVQTIDLNQLNDKMLQKDFSGLVVAMASWCPPCRKELPVLAQLHEKYHDKGIQIMAFSVDVGGPKVVQPLIDELKISFPVYWVGTKAVRHYKLTGIPTIMIYAHGRLLERLPGSHPRKVLEAKINALLTPSG